MHDLRTPTSQVPNTWQTDFYDKLVYLTLSAEQFRASCFCPQLPGGDIFPTFHMCFATLALFKWSCYKAIGSELLSGLHARHTCHTCPRCSQRCPLRKREGIHNPTRHSSLVSFQKLIRNITREHSVVLVIATRGPLAHLEEVSGLSNKVS